MEFIEEFNFQDRDPSQSIFILGGPSTGKTMLIKKLLQQIPSIVWAPHDYDEYQLGKFLHTDFDCERQVKIII